MSQTFLDGRVKVAQLETGFRSGLDAVMLAAAVPARDGDSALELGAGSGAAGLCLEARVPGVIVTGVERDAGLAALANENAVSNKANARFVSADIFALPSELKRDFDHVFANPPFHGEGHASPDAARAAALMDDGRLAGWLALGLQRTVSGGYFTAILRADRLNQALAAMPQKGLCAFPLAPRTGEAPKRVIVQARKGSNAPFALLPGLVLHQADGSWTPEADAVLRRGSALALSGARL
ncbi:MAG: methyltransferase [Alphaproteobacteria bacterium]|nr:methyltransferase [Alphaproteobacteria bacterium]